MHADDASGLVRCVRVPPEWLKVRAARCACFHRGPRRHWCPRARSLTARPQFDKLFKTFVQGEDDVSSRKVRFKFIPNIVKSPFLVSAALRTLGGMRCVVASSPAVSSVR